MNKHITLIYPVALASCFAAAFLGCTTTPMQLLTPEGQRVKIITSLDLKSAEQLTELGVIECTIFWSTATDTQECRVDLRNKAAAMGGEILMITNVNKRDCSRKDPNYCGIQDLTAVVYKK